MEHKDCFAYRDTPVTWCNALNEMICKSTSCPFYKGRYTNQGVRSEVDILKYSSTRGIHKGVV